MCLALGNLPLPGQHNLWLIDVLNHWNSPPISRIPLLHDVGKKIIQKLISFPISLPNIPSDSLTIKFLGSAKRGNIPPSMGLLLNDLLQPGFHNVWDFINQTSESGVTGKDVLASFIIPSTLLDMTSPERRLYGALDIPMTKDGLKVCKYEVSDYLQDKKYLIFDRAWTTTFTTSGAITHTYMDYYGCHQYMVHLFGHKLWLLWPPTEKNLECFAKFHTQPSTSNLTLHCLDELEGLQLFYTTTEQAFVLQPNVLHACMSVGTSAHTGTWVWMLPEYKVSLQMVEWGLKWMMGKVSTDAPLLDYKGEAETIKSEIVAWQNLLKKNHESDDAIAAYSQLEKLEYELSELQKLFKSRGKKRKRDREE